MSQDLTVRLEHHQGVPVVTVIGDLDVYSARQMYLQGRELADVALRGGSSHAGVPRGSAQARHSGLREGGSKPQEPTGHGGGHAPMNRRVLILDLSGVPFADSAGVGALIGVFRRAHDQGAALFLTGVNPRLAHLLHVMGLTKVLALHATVLDAAEAASSDGRRTTSTTAEADYEN